MTIVSTHQNVVDAFAFLTAADNSHDEAIVDAFAALGELDWNQLSFTLAGFVRCLADMVAHDRDYEDARDVLSHMAGLVAQNA